MTGSATTPSDQGSDQGRRRRAAFDEAWYAYAAFHEFYAGRHGMGLKRGYPRHKHPLGIATHFDSQAAGGLFDGVDAACQTASSRSSISPASMKHS